MSYLTAHPFDVSIVTRLRLRTWEGVTPQARAGVTNGAICGVLALLHLLTGLLFMFSAASGQAAGWHALPLDDTWVRLVYARNFAETFVLAYNSGSVEAGAGSPLWVMLVGMVHRILAFTGIGLPAVAKLLGMALALGTSVVALILVGKVTGNRLLGVAAAVIIALEPGYAYAKVSGAEVALFGFVALAAAAAFYHQRLALGGALLALAVLARPEGLLLAALALAALLLKLLWDRGDFRLMSRGDLVLTLKLAGPPALAGMALVLFNLLANGTPYPNSYLVKHVPLGLLDLPNLGSLARGYLVQTSFFSAAGMGATLLLLALAGYWLARQGRFGALPLIAFPLVLYYAISVSLPLDPEPWDFVLRRYLDPSLPFIIVGLVVGLCFARRALVRLGMSLRRSPAWVSSPSDAPRILGLRAGSTIARWAGLALALVFLLLALLPYADMPARWLALTGQYSWSNRHSQEVDVAAARWMNRNLEAGAVIGTPDVPGALGFFSNHRVVDLSGVNTHTAIGRPLFEAAQVHGVDYLVAYRSIYLDSWPLGEEVASFVSPARAGRELVVYRAHWDRPVSFGDKTVPHTIDTSGLRLLDSLDVGMAAQEESHFYSLTQPGGLVERIFHVAQEGGSRVAIRDQGRTTTGSEEFVTRSAPGQPLIIAKRYDAAVGGSVGVYVDGRFVGEWPLAPREFVFGEDTFRVGREFITGPTTHLRFQHLPGSGGSLNSFYYWVYTTD